MTNRLHHLISSVVLIAGMVAAGCGKKSESSSSEPPPTKDQVRGGDPKGTAGKPDISVDPVAWRADFRDGKAAMEKYKGKVIEMSGVVSSVADDHFDKGPCIYLKAEGEWSVPCATADPKPWLTVTPGSKIKLKGRLPIAISFQNPHLGYAEVIESGPKPESVTAVQITKAYAADGKSAKEKYHENWVNMEGEIIDAKVVAGNDMIVRLKGDGDYIVNCSIVKKGLEMAKPGQKVKAFGQLNVVDAGKVVYLYATALTEVK